MNEKRKTLEGGNQIMQFRWLRNPLLAALFAAAGQVTMAQVSPEIQLGARGIMSFNTTVADKARSSAINDFSDSGLLLGFRRKLYSNFRGQLVIGFQFPDADSDLGQIFFHQVFVKVENQGNVLKIGRSRVRSALIDFPTLRDDDALHFTDVLNPFSSGRNTEDNQFGNVLEFAHVFDQRYWLRLHGEHFRKTPLLPATTETDFSLNAIGASFQYRVPESQRWNREVVSQLGIGFNNFLTDRTGYTNKFDRALKNIIVSTILNLRPNPVHFWDVRHQTIFNVGFDQITQLDSFADLATARSVTTFTSLRYLYRKLERPSIQVSASFGYKSFPKLINTTEQLQFILNGFYRLGEDFDVGVQYQYRSRRGDLSRLYGANEHRIQLALVYSIDQLWNNQFDDRESLLNLEHGYIP